LWQELKLRIGNKTHSNKVKLWQDLQNQWQNLPQDRIRNLIESMPRCCDAVIAFKGMAT